VKPPVEVGQKVRFGREAFEVIEVYHERSPKLGAMRYSGWKVLAWKPGKTVRSWVEDFRHG